MRNIDVPNKEVLVSYKYFADKISEIIRKINKCDQIGCIYYTMVTDEDDETDYPHLIIDILPDEVECCKSILDAEASNIGMTGTELVNKAIDLYQYQPGIDNKMSQIISDSGIILDRYEWEIFFPIISDGRYSHDFNVNASDVVDALTTIYK